MDIQPDNLQFIDVPNLTAETKATLSEQLYSVYKDHALTTERFEEVQTWYANLRDLITTFNPQTCTSYELEKFAIESLDAWNDYVVKMRILVFNFPLNVAEMSFIVDYWDTLIDINAENFQFAEVLETGIINRIRQAAQYAPTQGVEDNINYNIPILYTEANYLYQCVSDVTYSGYTWHQLPILFNIIRKIGAINGRYKEIMEPSEKLNQLRLDIIDQFDTHKEVERMNEEVDKIHTELATLTDKAKVEAITNHLSLLIRQRDRLQKDPDTYRESLKDTNIVDV